jgi:hypothetical protein
MAKAVMINRAPVLTLWASVVAERLGFDRDEALTLGGAVAGLNAYSKGVSLGLFTPAPKSVKEKKKKLRAGETLHVDLLHRAVPVVHTPDSVARYLDLKFGDALDDARSAMQKLARSMSPKSLAVEAYRLYEKFRPSVPAGVRGWGAAGKLDVGAITALIHAD